MSIFLFEEELRFETKTFYKKTYFIQGWEHFTISIFFFISGEFEIKIKIVLETNLLDVNCPRKDAFFLHRRIQNLAIETTLDPTLRAFSRSLADPCKIWQLKRH